MGSGTKGRVAFASSSWTWTLLECPRSTERPAVTVAWASNRYEAPSRWQSPAQEA